MKRDKLGRFIKGGTPHNKKNGHITTVGYREYNRGSNGKILEHRLVMEQYLGRKLKSTEVIHHINHDKLDNRIENLQIVSHAEHKRVHPTPRDPISGKFICK